MAADAVLRQPDATTCGSCCLVRARMLLDGGYDAWVRADAGGGRVRTEALAAHARTNRLRGAGGRLQVPWPAALGTQPWALAAELSTVSGVDHTVRPVPPWSRDEAFERVREAAGAHQPVPVYVGNAWLPRHVVLVLSAAPQVLRVYDPASGRDVDVSRSAWTGGRLSLGGWRLPWAVVLSPGVRRTPA